MIDLRSYQKDVLEATAKLMPTKTKAPKGSGKAYACKRCNSLLVDGFCTDETCPFSGHFQDCEAGWSGHPEMDPNPTDDSHPIACTCDRAKLMRHLTIEVARHESGYYLNTYVCEFCGVYKALKPRCNKCEEEK